MTAIIELMESRTLLSATPATISRDAASLKSSFTQAKTDLTANLNAAAADLKALKAGLKTGKLTPAQKALVVTIEKDEKVNVAKLKKEVLAALSAGGRAGAQIASLAKGLQAHPTSTTLQTKLSAAVATLQLAITPQVITTVENDAGSAVNTVNGDLDALTASVPSAQAEVTVAKQHFAAGLTTLAADATTIQAHVTALASDLM